MGIGINSLEEIISFMKKLFNKYNISPNHSNSYISNRHRVDFPTYCYI